MPAAAIDVRGVPRAQALIERVGRRAMAPQPFLAAAAEIVQAGFKQQIDSKGGHYGSGWQPLAAATLERKARQGYPSDIMVQTGSLVDRVGSVERMAKLSVRVGVGRDFIARFKQTGTENEPRRQLLGVSGGDRGRIYALARRYLADGLL